MTACQCEVGYFMGHQQPSSSVFTCSKCPAGANCNQAGLTVDEVTSQRGWWRDWNSTDLALTRCVAIAHCAGGKNQCSANRDGPLCTFCFPGYSSAGFAASCEKCPEKQTTSVRAREETKCAKKKKRANETEKERRK